MGEMSRMTQYKDKSSKLSEDRISVGLFNYPVLKAADILLYEATYVPVGDDQTQHLEFTRDIATRLNGMFGDLLTVPKTVAEQHEFFGRDQGLRIKDLADPSKKMSKSDETGKGVIFLTDTAEVAHKKLMSATTDSLGNIAYDKATQPGLANLIELLALLQHRPVAEIASEHANQTQYGPLKAAVADEAGAFLNDFQARLSTIDDQQILHKLETSEARMREQANATLLKVQTAVGLR
jgi:tryptophanyl-tRNA synthetase